MAIKYYDLVTEDWEDWYGELRRGTRGEVKINGAFKKAWDSNPCPHIHDQYGRHPGEPGFDRNNVIEFQPWTISDSLPSVAGNYYLTTNVSLSVTWDAPQGSVNICLNGYEIKRYTTDGRVCNVANSTLSIYDCFENETTHPQGIHTVKDYYSNTKGTTTINITGGVITGGKTNNTHGGAIHVNNGYLNLYGGNVAGNSAQKGGAIYATSGANVNIVGGKITNNYAYGLNGVNTDGDGGGAIYTVGSTIFISNKSLIKNNVAEMRGGALAIQGNSTVNVTGGEISANKSLRGGAGCIWLLNNSNNRLNISNGYLKDNYAEASGGCIAMDGGTVNMSGGEISGNSAKCGGGICAWKSSVTTIILSGGIITRNIARLTGAIDDDDNNVFNGGGILMRSTAILKLSGDVKIIDNIKYNNAQQLTSNISIPVKYNRVITIDGELDNATEIGVEKDNSRTIFTSGFSTYNPDDDPSDFFISDDPAYEVTKVDGEAALTAV